MRNHDGSARAEDDVLFAEAPAVIGKVLSAGTTLKKDGRVVSDRPYEWLNALRLIPVGMGGGALIAFGILGVMEALGRRGPAILMMYGLGVGTLLSLAGAWYWMRRFAECTYVGELGIARFRRRGKRVVAEVCEFKDAVRVEQSKNDIVIQRGYEGTAFGMLWQGPNKPRMFLISGRYDDRKAIPTINARQFALAALAAWETFRAA